WRKPRRDASSLPQARNWIALSSGITSSGKKRSCPERCLGLFHRFGEQFEHRFAHGLTDEVVGFRVAVPVEFLGGRRLFFLSKEVLCAYERHIAFEFFMFRHCRLCFHQRERTRVFIFVA